jgi:hypothetical protein
MSNKTVALVSMTDENDSDEILTQNGALRDGSKPVCLCSQVATPSQPARCPEPRRQAESGSSDGDESFRREPVVDAGVLR